MLLPEKIGVVGFQGDVSEHIDILNSIRKRGGIDVEAVEVRKPEKLDGVSGIIIPGGESTTIYKLTQNYGIYDRIKAMANDGVPVMGTCAGLILISRETNDERVPGMGILDTEIKRNAYGRQINSFIENIIIDEIGEFQAVFIRAPVISSPGRSRVMARRGDEIVMVRQENIIGMTFHPELTRDTRIHEYFLGLMEREGYISSGR